MENFLHWVDTFCFLYTFLTLEGLVVYKFELLPAESWEDAIKKMFPAFFRWCAGWVPVALSWLKKWLYEEATGKLPQEEALNEVLLLSNQEVLEITKRHSGHPYDTPSLESYKTDHSVMWITISAVRTVPAYEGSENKILGKISRGNIQNYYMETREVQAPIWILKVSPKMLDFAIPLSEKGMEYLQKQYKDILAKEKEEKEDKETKLEQEVKPQNTK